MKYLICRMPDVVEVDDPDLETVKLKKGVKYPVPYDVCAVEYGSSIRDAKQAIVAAIENEFLEDPNYKGPGPSVYGPETRLGVAAVTGIPVECEMVVYSHNVRDTGKGAEKVYFGVIEQECSKDEELHWS